MQVKTLAVYDELLGTALVEQFGEPPILDRLRQEYLRPGDFRSSAKELEIRKT
jgi:hypothetical protein